MTLLPVSADDLRSHWSWVRAGIEKVIAKTGEKFLPEDVYWYLKEGRAWLYVLDGANGFVVVQLQRDFDGSALVVWVLWTEIGTVRHIDEIKQELRRLRDAAHAKHIRAFSPRHWELLGLEEVSRVYEMR